MPAPDQHSDIVGGSSAAKRLACPGSYQMEQKLPPSTKNESSSYADEGTALHEAMQYILMANVVDLDTIVGMTFGVGDRNPSGYVMTRELVDEALAPCVQFFDELDDAMQAEGGMAFLVEQRCEFPGIPNSFGTCDLIARTDKRTIIVDWKFGVGVPVRASYTDGETTKPNAQLAYYARAAQFTKPEMFENRPDWLVQMYIVQPRARDGDGTSKAVVNLRELESFRMDLVRAVGEAQGENPRIVRGEHCRFAKCKTICPHFLNPSMDLVGLHTKLTARKATPLGAVDVAWDLVYDEMLTFCDLAEMAIREMRAGAHAYLEEGGKLPNWKLVDKRAVERYADETGAVRHVIGLGVEPEATFETVVKSPAQLRAVLEPLMEGKTKKERTDRARDEIAAFTTKTSSGTTLAPMDDKRAEAINASDVIASLSSKLSAITGRT